MSSKHLSKLRKIILQIKQKLSVKEFMTLHKTIESLDNDCNTDAIHMNHLLTLIRLDILTNEYHKLRKQTKPSNHSSSLNDISNLAMIIFKKVFNDTPTSNGEFPTYKSIVSTYSRMKQ